MFNQGWKLALAHWPMASQFYIGVVEILSELVKFPMTSIQIMSYGNISCDLRVLSPVDKQVRFHACQLQQHRMYVIWLRYIISALHDDVVFWCYRAPSH